MENVINSVLVIDLMGLLIAISLVYYQFHFKVEKRDIAQKIIPVFVLFVCISDVIEYKAGKNMMLGLTIYTISRVLQCLMICLTLKLLSDRIPFLAKHKGLKRYRIVITALILAGIASALFISMSEVYPAEGVPLQVEWFVLWTYVLDYVMVGFAVIYGLILFVISLIKKEKEGASSSITVVVTMILYLGATAVRNKIISPQVWDGQGMGFAMGYGFLYMILNTSLVVEEKKKEAMIAADLNMAHKIQQDALPKDMPAYPHHPGLSVSACMEGVKDVAGDFFDYFEIDENHICFLIADVSGKGMPASLFMMTAKTTLKTLASGMCDTAEIMEHADRMLSKGNTAGMFVTVWLGIFNTDTLELEYTNAGHNPPVFMGADGRQEYLRDVNGTVIGMGMNKPFSSGHLKISSGDRIFLYTDGITEAHDINDGLFGEQRMTDILTEHRNDGGAVILGEIKEKLAAFSAGREQFDDITMLMIDFNISDKPLDSFEGLEFLNEF